MPPSPPQNPPLRIAIDIRILQGEDATRGIGHYTRGLVEALLRNREALRIEIVLIASAERPSPKLDPQGALDMLTIVPPGPGKYPWSPPCDARALADAATNCNARVLHVSSPLHGPFNWIPARGPIVTVATIYDLIPVIDSRNFIDTWPPEARRRYQKRMQAVAKLPALFAISQSVAQDITQRLRVPDKKITIAYPALRPNLVALLKKTPPENKFGTGASPINLKDPLDRDNFLLAFGSTNPSKNCETLLRGYALLPAEIRRRHPLKLAGSEGPNWQAWIHPRLRDLGIENEVELIGAVSDIALAQLYQQARLFILPSRLEGFGLPPLEAMTAGTPLLAADIPVLREIVGEGEDGQQFFDPNEPTALAQALEATLHRPPAELVRDSEKNQTRASQFSWQSTAKTVAETYHEIVSK